jgi:DNA-binding MarR family transcriptional regulator
MSGRFDSRHPLVGLADEVVRLSGRMKSTFAASRRSVGLGESEAAVLNAVVEADRPVTVPQIGRSFGAPRQLVQRAAHALIAEGLIQAVPNPDHKRAALLRPTPAGIAIKRRQDAIADEIAHGLPADFDIASVRIATEALRHVREALEMRLRGLPAEDDDNGEG